jgi:ribonuclease HI
MNQKRPHFLLFSSVQRNNGEGNAAARWHFVLESVEDGRVIEAGDDEPGAGRERLELLAVVRGLEALDQPSRVTLVTCSRQVSRGLRCGLETWRANDWCWERFDRFVPVANADLWQRIDRALAFHRVNCRMFRFDEAADQDAENRVTVKRPVVTSTRGRSRRFGSTWRQVLERFFSLPLVHRSAV